MKKTRGPARNATRQNNIFEEPSLDEELLSQYDNDWHSVAGGEKREKKKRKKMPVSGKSVFVVKKIITRKSN
jgi:hypothetical protein